MLTPIGLARFSSFALCLALLLACSIVWAGAAQADSEATTVEATTVETTTVELTQADLFPTDRVIEVQIEVPDALWDTIRNQSRNFMEVLHEKRKLEPIESPYTYVDADVTIDGRRFSNVGLRKKGFVGSQSTSRPSLKLNLDKYDPSTEIDGLSMLTLNNNKQDPTLVYQYMGYELFRQAGSPAPRCSFAKVTLNGEPLGIYSHVESVRKPLIAREFGSDQGVLYEGTIVDFHEGWAGGFEPKFGDEQAGREKIEQLIAALSTVDDADVENTIGKFVDLDAFYKFWAIEGLLGFWDGYSGNRNNFFVYLNPENDKFYFLPWGADALFQKNSMISRQPGAPISVKTTGIIAHKLYQTQAGRERYEQQLRELLEHHWNEEELLAETDRIEALLKPHLGPTQASQARELEKVRQFIRTRRADLLAEMADGMPLWEQKPGPPPVMPSSMARGMDPNSIWFAAKAGNAKRILQLLDEGTDVNGRDPMGTTPLVMAVLGDQLETMRLLIDNGADVNASNNEQRTAMHVAAFFGLADATAVLVDNGADVNARNEEGETPLDAASAPWNEQTQGAVTFISNMVGMKADLEAVKTGRSEIVELLGDHDAKLGADMPPLEGKNLWESAKLGNLNALERYASEADVDLNGQDKLGITPLCWAAMAGQIEAARLLLDKGADVNAKNKDSGTPLHAAAFLGRREIVALLIEHDAKLNHKSQMGQTPLESVASEWNEQMQGMTQFIASFLKIKVDIDEVKAARPEIAKLLREHGGKTSGELE